MTPLSFLSHNLNANSNKSDHLR